MNLPARYWHLEADGRIRCELCPRGCQLREGQRGFCFVRQRQGQQMVLTAYGMHSGSQIDPIEKKPLHHFYPGSKVYSFGMIGCNLGCQFCQNWNISKSKEAALLRPQTPPGALARQLKAQGIKSLAMTYNDPVPYIEYGSEIARACQEEGVQVVLVTAGYVSAKARPEYFENVDAANIDLKAFDADFYHRLCKADLQEVLDTLVFVREHTQTWLELTNLIIPSENDSPSSLREMARWVVQNLGPETPLHFSAFHPDYKMTDLPRTSLATLRMAWEIAKEEGLHYVYTGNVHDLAGDCTFCPHCGKPVIERDWYQILSLNLRGTACGSCGSPIAGRFED